MFFKLFARRKSPTNLPRHENIEAVLAEMEARTGTETRAEELPAWALLFRSPYKSYPEATSWLGGVPQVPAAFEWPTGENGRPLHFIAQIDLAALKSEPTTMAHAPGLPAEGALLIFIGAGYAVRVLSARDIAHAAAATPPSTLEDVRSRGFWGQGSLFPRWPVDPVAYLSRGEERPECFPDPFATPQQWITSWGIAALEASLTHDSLELELRLGREFMEYRLKLPVSERLEFDSPAHIQERIAHCELMEAHAPKLLATLEDWQRTCATRPAEAPVDVFALTGIFTDRTHLSRAMENNYGARRLLEGSACAVWEKILAVAPGQRDGKDFSAIAPAYRPLIEAWVTDWRRHRLFGLEPEFPNNGEDLCNQNPLISIGSDVLLGTESEHDYGFSVWLKDEDIAHGHHEGGQFIRHCAV